MRQGWCAQFVCSIVCDLKHFQVHQWSFTLKQTDLNNTAKWYLLPLLCNSEQWILICSPEELCKYVHILTPIKAVLKLSALNGLSSTSYVKNEVALAEFSQ